MHIKRINGYVSKKIDDEYIVFDINKGKVYELNITAEYLWKYLWKPRKIMELITKIAVKFKISPIKAEKDIHFFISEYQNKLFYLKK